MIRQVTITTAAATGYDTDRGIESRGGRDDPAQDEQDQVEEQEQ
jgi:hypothetical protein